MPQMVAHHTLGGCNLQPGDLLGTGTISCEVGAMQSITLPVIFFAELSVHNILH